MHSTCCFSFRGFCGFPLSVELLFSLSPSLLYISTVAAAAAGSDDFRHFAPIELPLSNEMQMLLAMQIATFSIIEDLRRKINDATIIIIIICALPLSTRYCCWHFFFFLTWAGNKLRTFKCKNRPELRLLTRGGPAGSASKVFSIAMPDATPSLWGYLLRAVRELALALSVCFCCLPWSTLYLLPVPCCTTFFVGSRICPRFMSHTHSRDREQASLALCVCVRACESVCHEYACVHYAGLLLYQRKWCRTLTAA